MIQRFGRREHFFMSSRTICLGICFGYFWLLGSILLWSQFDELLIKFSAKTNITRSGCTTLSINSIKFTIWIFLGSGVFWNTCFLVNPFSNSYQLIHFFCLFSEHFILKCLQTNHGKMQKCARFIKICVKNYCTSV